jgi:hypothetical protein
MRKFVAIAAIAASAAATVVASPLAAHAAGPFGAGHGEIRTNCQNGVTGFYNVNGGSPTEFGLVPGSEQDFAGGPGVWNFTVNQPAGQETYGPGLGQDQSFPGMVQRVDKVVVTLDGGRQMVFFNDKANSITFNAVSAAHVFYNCGFGRS